MAKNQPITGETANAIDKHVERVLRDLGYPEPPLRLEDVRSLLRLDLRHYSSTDVTWLEEKLHKLRVAGKQVLARPRLILDVVTKLDLKALFLPDQKRILVDADLPHPKQRWGEAHEIVHSVLPWHEGVAMGDKKRTLSIACHTQIESEANYGAGRLLFLGTRFTDQLADATKIDLKLVKHLKMAFGNSLTTTLWRIVENLDSPACGLVSIHPRSDPPPGTKAVRYFVRSPEFVKRFSSVTESELFGWMRRFCYGKRGPIGAGEVLLRDDKGDEHVFFLECFNNHYDTLTLGTHTGCRKVAVVSGR